MSSAKVDIPMRGLRPLTARRGFTIVEMVVVVLIIGIAAAVAVPKYVKSLCYYRCDTAAKRIAADFEWAQRRARTMSASQAVQFTVNTSSYTMPGLPDPTRPGSDYTVKLTKEPFDVTLISATFGSTSNMTFDGYGHPNTGGAVVVRAGSTQRTITVDADSGKASVQ
jgi:prepilin-type N-terminal cleavage/methylation domain-containing protein